MRPAKKADPVRPTAKSKIKIKASPTERAAALLSALRPIVRHHLPLLRRSADLHADFCTFFRECLTPWLNYYTAIDGLLTDAIDLETAVFYGVPDRLSRWLIELLAGRPAVRILSAFTRRHLTRALRLLSRRLDPPDEPVRIELLPDDPFDPLTNSLALELEDVISDFATAVFFANPQPKPATVDERKAARHQRLEIYFHVAEYRHIKMTFTQVCKLAGVPWMGTGSGRDWRNGKLRDLSPVSRKIEAVIGFRTIK
jgi:hypothetical protein